MENKPEKLRQDKTAEMLYGEGAIETVGKILLKYYGKAEEGFDLTIIAGAVSENLMSDVPKEKFRSGEMWECKLVIIPIRKFTNNKEYGWDNLDTDQKLASAWGGRESWKTEITKDGHHVLEGVKDVPIKTKE
jgi:hypothetical protein